MFRHLVIAVGFVLATSVAAAAQEFEKGWLDVSFGVASAAEKEFGSARVIVISQEFGGGAAAYGVPRGGSFDVGGGYMFNSRVGLGVSLAGTAHEDTAGLAISIPHPLVFNASASDATVTSGVLTRAEGAWHIHAMLVAAQTPRIRLRVFGGPSYFRAEQETVSGIEYDQVFQVFGRGNVVDITSYTTSESVGTGWGGHFGADVAVFFNRVFGVGAVVRVSRGSVEIADYGPAHDIKTGGVQFGGGLRLKF
ncbi:MAG: hypothetical protein AB7F99_07665 [Vicinamibacterales bacterium]